MSLSKSERTGVLLNLLAAVFWGLFPVLVNRGTQSIPPLFFAAFATFFTTIATLIYVLSQGKIHELKNRKTYFPLFSLLVLFVYYGENISQNQWIGMVIMMIGVYFSIKRPSIDPSLTKYR